MAASKALSHIELSDWISLAQNKSPTRFIFATTTQWESILADANLIGIWIDLHSAGLALISLHTEPIQVIGKSAVRRANELLEKSRAFAAATTEVRRFYPPKDSLKGSNLVDKLAINGLRFGRLVAQCAKEGWDESTWANAKRHAQISDASARQLEQELGPPNIGDPEDRIYRAIGIREDELETGTGLTFAARLAAAWEKNSHAYERRLRKQSQHLLNSKVALAPKTRLHLVMLLLSDRPLLAQRAALLTRNLIDHLLVTDPVSTLSLIEAHVEREPLMLSTHRAFISARDRYAEELHDEARMRPVFEMYKTTVEGDIKRTAELTLRLLKKPVPSKPTLSPILDQLIAARQPITSLLASPVVREWRNAVAHEDIYWDSEAGMAVADGHPFGLNEILARALQARSICQGFEHGIAICYASTGAWTRIKKTSNEVSGRLGILYAFGEAGLSAVDLYRVGTTVKVDAPRLTDQTLRKLLAATISASVEDNHVELWDIRLPDDYPPLQVSRKSLDMAMTFTISHGSETHVHLPFASLPMIAEALSNINYSEILIASTITAIAAGYLLSELERLAQRLTHDDQAAADEIFEWISSTSRALRATGGFLSENKASKLNTFAAVLDGIWHQHRDLLPSALLHALTPARRAYIRNGPVHLPWISQNL
ncbi:hypothetical protein BJY14_005691 [Actinomadura luteofluorescens]|uniref:Uncharacterized protein n=1 Tax=Actinomadura luteofluorescens TaxID=46163 RepID=A0A7Y9EKZ0_9ACTN|nr:hypothetical protein [Actinomadura luteofluorescens]